MLASLEIKNIVLIEHLKIDFKENLSALTGETGAGKSILLDSLGLALGARSDAGLVRHGTEKSSVTADFDLPSNHIVFDMLKENDIDSDGELILRRTLTSEGRSKAFINDQTVSVSLFKQIGQQLVEIHGQFDTHHLMNATNHIHMLDAYADTKKDLSKTSAAWQDWRSLQKMLDLARAGIDKARVDEEFYLQSLEDLDALDPQLGEEEKLSRLRARLMRREHILENLNEAKTGFGELENNTGTVWRAIDKLGEDGKDVAQAMTRMDAEMQEVLDALQAISHDVENSEFSLEEIDNRLFALKAQARKFECTIEGLPSKREEIANALNAIENQDSNLAQMIHDVEKAKSHYQDAALTLSSKRQKASQKLANLVMKELAPLKLEKARFEVQVTRQEDETDWNILGMDEVQFLVATNPGADAGALNKIASGGELSRFTLALKVILAQTGMANTLVFDEVDSGIGGATAAAVGERLKKLARHKQILVVTHSPQVASMASHHWIVSKSGTKSVTTNIIPLHDVSERTEEIARMLAGAEVTSEARAAAMKLLEVSDKSKAA